MKKRVFSGIQPSGNLHIGNYIGAIKQWVKRQETHPDFQSPLSRGETHSGLSGHPSLEGSENFFCVVDLHAITVPQVPKILQQKIREVAALYIASGIDPAKSVVFVQSHNSDHANLAWILNCFTGMGELERMTQFKDKSRKQKEFISAGLFDYPVLMAADILLYDTDEVPVGDDQKQHVELTRDVAGRFNSRFGETFKLPEPVIGQWGARIMSLQDPLSKMSKSDENPNGAIGLLDDPDVAAKKIMRAVTDSGSEVRFAEDKPAVSNLLQIYSELSGKEIAAIESEYEGKGYGDFKKGLAEVVNESLKELQGRYFEVMESGELEKILAEGAQKAQAVSSQKLKEVMDRVGLG